MTAWLNVLHVCAAAAAAAAAAAVAGPCGEVGSLGSLLSYYHVRATLLRGNIYYLYIHKSYIIEVIIIPLTKYTVILRSPS